MNEPLPRVHEWARTMHGYGDDVVVAHRNSTAWVAPCPPRRKEERKELEGLSLDPTATSTLSAE